MTEKPKHTDEYGTQTTNETVSQLVQRAADKEMEIAELKYQLTKMNFQVESLNAQLTEMELRNKNQVEIIEITLDELDRMNTVWDADHRTRRTLPAKRSRC